MGFFHFGNKEKTTETVVDSIVKSGTQQVLSLREKIWKIEISPRKWVRFFDVHRKNFAILGACLVAFIGVVFYFSSSADVATFYPTSCLGGWENPKNAEGPPELKHNSPLEDFNSENSAVLKDSNAEFYCGGFTGAIPQESFPKTAVLKLVWSVDDGDVDHSKRETSNSDEDLPIAETESIEIQTENTSNESDTTESTNSESAPSDTPPVSENQEEESAPSSEESSNTEPEPTPEPQVQSFFPLIPIARAEDEIPNQESAQEAEPISEPAPEPTPEPEAEQEPSPETSSPDTDIDTATTSDITVIESPENEESSSDEEREENMITPSVVDDFMEISYTEDGTKWKSLARISRASWQTGEYVLPIDLSKWENINNFQVRLTPITTIDTPPVVYLDSMSIEVVYEEEIIPTEDTPTIKITDPSINIISEDGNNTSNDSQEFIITDPNLSTSELYDLVEEGKAEVIQDNAGIFTPKPNPGESLETIKEVIPPMFMDKEEDATSIDSPPESTTDGTISLLYEDFPKNITLNTTIKKFAAVNAAFWQAQSDISLGSSTPKLARENRSLGSSTPKSTKWGFWGLDGGVKVAHAQNVLPPVSVRVFNSNNEEIVVHSTVTTVFQGGRPRHRITLERPREFRPGLFRMQVTIHSNGSNIISEQDFSWGVLSINIDRSIEQPGNDAYLQFGVLDDTGYTICSADLDLKITGPTGTVYNFSTSDETIVREEQCGPNNIIDTPDYYAHFIVPNNLGRYSMQLTAHTFNGERTIEDFFDVQSSVDFDVRRVGPTRIYPYTPYPVTMYIKATDDWEGTIIETVPVSFEITPPQQSMEYDSIETVGNEKIIRWHLSLDAGEEARIGYYFDAPDISPEFYLLGPAKFFTDINSGDTLPTTANFQEVRQWQIAADLACTSQVATGNWNTIGTWSCARVPTTADTVIIANGHNITIDSAPNSVISVVINNGGTLTGGSATLTIGNTAAGGTAFTNNGTWSSGTGTVRFSSNANVTLFSGSLTGSNKFNNITFNPAITTAKTITGGAAVEAGGDFFFGSTSCSSDLTTLTLGGTTTITGTLTIDSAADTDCSMTITTGGSNHALSAGFISLPTSGGTGVNTLTANASTITLTGTTGDLFTNAGTFTEGTSTITVSPTGAGSPDIFSAAETVYILKIDAASATIINAGANITTNNTAGNKLWVAAGVFNQESRTITAGTAGTLQIDSGATLCLGGSTTSSSADCKSSATPTSAQAMPTFTTYTFDAASTVIYLSDANTTISNTPTYGNLVLQPVLQSVGRTYTMGGAMTINGNFTATVYSALGNVLTATVNLAGTVTVAATKTTTISGLGNGTALVDLRPSSTDYNLSTGFLALSGATLDATSAASTITLSGTGGTLFAQSGTFTITSGTPTVNLTGAGDATVNSGTPTFYNLTSSGTGTKTLGNNITVNGVLTISAGTFAASTRTITLAGTTGTPFPTPAGTFDAGTGTVTYTGANAGGNTTILPTTYYNLTLNASGETFVLAGTTTVDAAGTTTITLGTLDTTGSNYSLSTGKISIAGSQTLIANASTITLTATSGTLFTKTGTFTQGTSEVVVNAASGTYAALLSAATTFHRLTINTSMTVVNAGAVITMSSADANNRLYIQSGVLNDGGNTIVGTANGTLVVDGGAELCITGPTSATTATCDSSSNSSGVTSTFPTNYTVGNITLAATSTVYYLADATQTISSTPVYGNLTLSPVSLTASRTWTFASGTVTINGNFYIHSRSTATGLVTVNMGGDITVAATGTTTLTRTADARSTLDLDPGVDYNLSTGFLVVDTGCILDATTAASTITLTGTSGTLFTKTGTFTITSGTPTVSVTSASGTPTLLSATTTFYNLTINSAATVVNMGAFVPTINNNLTVTAGVFNASGASITGPGAGAGTLTIGTTGTLCLGGTTASSSATCNSGVSDTTTRAMPTFQTYTFDDASTVRYLSDATTTVSRAMSYGNLVLSPVLTSGRAYTFGSGAITIDGDFNIHPTGSGLLTVNPAGNITVGTTKTTTVTGTTATSTLDLDPGTDYNLSTGSVSIGANGTIDGTSSASTITVADDWSNAGTFTAGSTEVILNTAATAAVGGGPTTFYKLTITHSLAKEVNFSITADHIIHVTNLFSVTGSSGQLIKLFSSSAGSKWHFHPTGTAFVDYANVKDGGCESGSISITPTNTTNGNNNDSCWNFGDPTATFAISDSTVGFGTLSSLNARYATGDLAGDTSTVVAHTLSATTNATYGYTILVNGNTLTSGGDTVSAIGDTNTGSSVGTEQFGLRMTAAGGTGAVSVPYAAAGFALDTGAFPDEVASASSGDGVETVYSVRYLANISQTTPPGSYTSTLTYIMVPSF